MKDLRNILIIIAVVLGIFLLYWFNILKQDPWIDNPLVDYSCNVDSDCEVKNLGNQCGYYPRCVNKNYQPHPPELSSMVCGFPTISGCRCVENKCQDITGVTK